MVSDIMSCVLFVNPLPFSIFCLREPYWENDGVVERNLGVVFQVQDCLSWLRLP